MTFIPLKEGTLFVGASQMGSAPAATVYNGVTMDAESTDIVFNDQGIRMKGHNPSSNESSYFHFRLPEDYVVGGSGISLDIGFVPQLSASGVTRIQCGYLARKSTELISDTPTWLEAQDLTMSGTANQLDSATFLISNTAVEVGDLISVILFRNGGAAADTHTGRWLLTGVRVRYPR